MPTDNKTREKLMVALQNAGMDYLAAEDDLEKARQRRDKVILRASHVGLSRREVASMANVTAGRVQQIIDAAKA